jgi:hypothetical protein
VKSLFGRSSVFLGQNVTHNGRLLLRKSNPQRPRFSAHCGVFVICLPVPENGGVTCLAQLQSSKLLSEVGDPSGGIMLIGSGGGSGYSGSEGRRSSQFRYVGRTPNRLAIHVFYRTGWYLMPGHAAAKVAGVERLSVKLFIQVSPSSSNSKLLNPSSPCLALQHGKQSCRSFGIRFAKAQYRHSPAPPPQLSSSSRARPSWKTLP